MQLERGEFVEMEVGKTVVVDDPAGAFSVTAYDANHCPGNFRFHLFGFAYLVTVYNFIYYVLAGVFFFFSKT